MSRPSTGVSRVRGRVAPLLSVGVGFHPEMSGRENVYINGMLLGLRETEIRKRFDEIVAFAELDSFIDTPVKFYSSGMFMRLGFSVAVHVDPQVLLVDEVLAVGDLAFQLKCFDRMRELKESGATVIIVSHSMHAIRLLCPRAILLRHGGLELDGDVEEVIARHHELLSDEADAYDEQHGPGHVGGVTVVERDLRDAHGSTRHLTIGEPMTMTARLRFETEVDSPQVHFTVFAADGSVAYEMRSVLNRAHRSFAAGDEATASVRFTPQLAGGTYRFVITVASIDGRRILHQDQNGMLIYVEPKLGSSGIADLDATISLDDDVLSDYPDLTL